MFSALHVPSFALQAVLRTEPALAGRPVALAADTGALVRLCTAAAHEAGVRPGQSLPQAVARCPALLVRPAHPDLEREAEAVLLTAAFAVSSQVELTAPGVATLDLAPLAPARREPALRHALADLAAAGLESAAGLAPTPLLAFYAACHAPPGGILAGTRELLDRLPLAVAEPTPEQAGILGQWGLHTLGQLAALPQAAITHRLGRTGLELWQRASGGAPRPLRIQPLPREFTASLDCEQELETLEPLLFIFRRFIDRLAGELRNAHLAAQAVQLALVLADDSRHEHLIRLPEPATDPALLFRALHTYLETLRTRAAIHGVRLRLVPVRSLVRQRDLFDGGLRDPHAFADTLARVSALVGSDRVGAPVPANTHQPDRFHLAPPPAALPPPPAGFAHPPRGLALRRLRPPRPAKVELAGPRPVFVWTAGIEGRVVALTGPWHASGGWWQGDRLWQREEWDVELEGGGLYRLARLPAEGWFIEGEYD